MLTSRVVLNRGADGNEDVHGPRVEVLVRIPLARAVEVGLVRGGSVEAPAAFLAAVEACVERVLSGEGGFAARMEAVEEAVEGLRGLRGAWLAMDDDQGVRETRAFQVVDDFLRAWDDVGALWPEGIDEEKLSEMRRVMARTTDEQRIEDIGEAVAQEGPSGEPYYDNLHLTGEERVDIAGVSYELREMAGDIAGGEETPVRNAVMDALRDAARALELVAGTRVARAMYEYRSEGRLEDLEAIMTEGRRDLIEH